ncbi:hypothetical protein R2F25_30575 [Streptomyces sp. UP1A-1]|nr:hypothetical protein [Streptomyces sp. UP1A-1]
MSQFTGCPLGAEQPLDVLGDDVHLEVDRVAGLLDAERGQGEGGGDEADGEEVGAGVDDGEADAVDGDGALLHDVAGEVGGQRDLDDLPVLGGLALQDLAGAVDVALHDVPAEAGADGGGAFQVDAGAGGEGAQAGAVQGLRHHVGGELVALVVDDGEADAVDGDGVAVPCPLGDHGAAQAEATGVVEGLDGGDLAQLFDDSGEHFPGPPASSGTDSGAVDERQKGRAGTPGATTPDGARP